MALHKNITPANVHIIHAYVYADSAARLAASLKVADIGKVALQQSDSSFWVLTNNSPLTWVSLAGGSASVYGMHATAVSKQVSYSTYDPAWYQYLRLTTPTLEAGTYRVDWSAEWRIDSNGDYFGYLRILQDGSTEISREVGRSTSLSGVQRFNYSGMRGDITLSSGVHTFDLECASDPSWTYLTTVYRAALSFLRIA